MVSLWKKYLYRAVEYSDKESMSKYLDKIQEGFLIDYSICEDYISDEELYKAFIKPWEKELFDNIKKIYIARDSFLCDIPFELLLKKEITYLESGRDLIIRANEECGNGAIIIGNPEYDYKNIIDYGDNRNFINEEIKSLPFSEIETKLIAKKTKC